MDILPAQRRRQSSPSRPPSPDLAFNRQSSPAQSRPPSPEQSEALQPLAFALPLALALAFAPALAFAAASASAWAFAARSASAIVSAPAIPRKAWTSAKVTSWGVHVEHARALRCGAGKLTDPPIP